MTVRRHARLFQFLLILIAFQMPLLHTKAFAAPSAPDPAVTYANSVGKGPARYSEGYFGTGDDRLHYVEAGKGPLVILDNVKVCDCSAHTHCASPFAPSSG